MRAFTRTLLLSLVVLLSTAPLRASSEVERLVALARVWSSVKYLHPDFIWRKVPWDDALMRAIPKVRAAKSDAEFEAAVASMLTEVGDPATRVDDPDSASVQPTGAEPTFGRLDGDTYIMNAGAMIESGRGIALYDAAQAAQKDIRSARFIVVDLRTARRNSYLWFVADLSTFLARDALTAPARFTATYSGYPPERGMSSGGYYAGWTSFAGMDFEGGASDTLERVAFVVSTRSPVPPLVAAMKAAGRAVVVSDAPFSPGSFSSTLDVPLSLTKRSAVIRIDDMAAEVVPDAVVASADPSVAIVRARELVRTPSMSGGVTARNIPLPIKPFNDAFESITGLPDAEMRLLAAFRIWSVIDRFYPYKSLIGDWDAAFARSLPSFIAATDRTAYLRAILALTANVADGHTTVSGPGIPDLFGPQFFPAEVRVIGGEYVVTAMGAEGEAVGLRIGDIVRTVDGEALRDRVARIYPLITGSREPARTNRVVRYALRGAAGSTADAVIERGGASVALRVPRTAQYKMKEPAQPRYRMLTDDIGYADLTRVETADVDAMFTALGKAKSIIFDMRGYPNGTAWSIAPRLGSGEPRTAALFSRMSSIASLSERETDGSYSKAQSLPDGRNLSHFTGRTYMLIDDRAISQSEHTGLFFEVANGTEFIGTPSAGANGDVTSMVLPGNIFVSFSGHEVRHANGEQLQRIGLKPHLTIEPTIAGLQQGRDEVLDGAIAYVKGKK